MSLKKIFIVANWFESEQLNNKLSKIGLESESLLINNFSLISSLILVIFSHLFVYFFFLTLKSLKVEENRSKIFKIAKFIVTKGYTFLAFGYYIRTIIESFLILFLSAYSEIYNFNNKEISKIISLGVSILILTSLILFSIYLYT